MGQTAMARLVPPTNPALAAIDQLDKCEDRSGGTWWGGTVCDLQYEWDMTKGDASMAICLGKAGLDYCSALVFDTLADAVQWVKDNRVAIGTVVVVAGVAYVVVSVGTAGVGAAALPVLVALAAGLE